MKDCIIVMFENANVDSINAAQVQIKNILKTIDVLVSVTQTSNDFNTFITLIFVSDANTTP